MAGARMSKQALMDLANADIVMATTMSDRGDFEGALEVHTRAAQTLIQLKAAHDSPDTTALVRAQLQRAEDAKRQRNEQRAARQKAEADAETREAELRAALGAERLKREETEDRVRDLRGVITALQAQVESLEADLAEERRRSSSPHAAPRAPPVQVAALAAAAPPPAYSHALHSSWSGKIATYLPARKFGFIRPTGCSRDEDNIFFHVDDWKASRAPQAGLSVSFTVVDGKDGKPKAVNVNWR